MSPDNEQDAATDSIIKQLRDQLRLRHQQAPQVDATRWFLGPKGEHEQLLRGAITTAITAHLQARKDYQPDDPHFNSLSANDSSAMLQQSESVLSTELQKLLNHLRASVPLASYRNQSHMYWDITLPAIVGYFAAMLYNQNNVAAEASPVTTAVELNVGSDLCTMLGFNAVSAGPEETRIVPWGHITCDGSIANAESSWVARNLKFLPIALAAAIRTHPDMHAARGLMTTTCQGHHARLIDLSNWELLNLHVDEVIALPARVLHTTHIKEPQLRSALDACSIQTLGLMRAQSQYLDNPEHANMIVCAPATAHYSWPKNAALLGLGVRAVYSIRVDQDGRMDIVALRATLDECLQKQWPVLQVVAVMGTTEEGAVDPLADIVQLREEYRALGLEFMIHADAAWGGYFASLIRKTSEPPSNDRAANIDDHPELQLSEHVAQQLHALRSVDTITVDPHKSGFVPYPAGSLCYRNGAHRHLIAYTAPVVDHDEGDKAVGSFGIEGSKPGAAPVSVYLSHAVIPLNEKGYGRLLGRCIFNNKRFHAALLCMPEETDLFTVTSLQRIPAEKEAKSAKEIKEELDFIRNEIVRRADNDDLFAFLEKGAVTDDSREEAIRARRALKLFKAIGSDLSIIAYSFNFKTANGINRDVTLMNEMNDWLFRQMSLNPREVVKGEVPRAEMIVTASEFRRHPYGDEFMKHFATRTGVRYQPDQPIKFLISTTQNPWLTATSDGNFIGKLMAILRRKANEAAQHVMDRYGIAKP